MKEYIAFIFVVEGKVLVTDSMFPRGEMIEEEDFQRALNRVVFESVSVRVQDYNFACSLYEGEDRIHYFHVKDWLGELKVPEGFVWIEKMDELKAELDRQAMKKLMV